MHKGEVLGVFGLMGSGRSEMAQIIFGLETYDRGDILVNGKPVNNLSPSEKHPTKIAFVTENRREEGLMMTSTVAENMGLVALPDITVHSCNVVRRSALMRLDLVPRSTLLASRSTIPSKTRPKA